MKTHSSIPWVAYHQGIFFRWGNKIAECLNVQAVGPAGYYRIDGEEAEANARFIVHCVNSHQVLAGALEAIANQATSESNGHDKLNQIAEIAQSALRQAKEREA